MLVMQPKKRTSSKLFGPDLLSGIRVAPANLSGDVGVETQKADIHQVVCPKKTGALRCRHVSKLLAPNSFVRKSCPENGSPRKCSGWCWWCGAKSGRTRIFRLTQNPEKRYIGIMISTSPGAAVVRPKTRTRNETRPRFGGPETRPGK